MAVSDKLIMKNVFKRSVQSRVTYVQKHWIIKTELVVAHHEAC